MFKKVFFALTILSLAFGGLGLVRPAAASTVALADLAAGDLIRGQSLSAVYYYAKDGFRYVFPNDKTYFTWYADFDDVKWLSDADLGKIQIGGNVTYKPGIKMIKINSDPKTYAVGENGALHWVTSEAVAIALYGSNWNTKIDDVPDGFFSNYSTGSDIEESDDFSPTSETAAATNIDSDKNLKAPYLINITNSGYSDPDLTISAGRAVKFTNKGGSKHTATAEDLTWGSGTLNAGDSFTRYFNKTGTFEYFCSYHASETGTITVE
jgi:plastocyanin